MARANRFTKLDTILPITTKGKGTKKTRKVATDRTKQDAVSKQLAECQRPSDIAMMASKFGFEDKDIIQWAKDAPNFGMFRMRIGNRLRGVVSRIAAAKKKGITLSVKDAAYAKKTRSQKTIAKKTSKKKVAKKAAKKKKRKRKNRV